MTTKELIRREIERRKEYISVTHFAEDLLSFLDTLPDEPVSDDLEEAAEKSAILQYEMSTNVDKAMQIMSARIFHEIGFKAGAEWQKTKQEPTLTIEDVEKLHTFLYAVKNNKHGAFTFTRLSNEQYEEVIRRFNKTKER